MAQYCRYCSHLVYGDVCFCEKKRWVKSYNSCKKPNKCKDFELNPIDALGENQKDYKPRSQDKKMEQISI